MATYFTVETNLQALLVRCLPVGIISCSAQQNCEQRWRSPPEKRFQLKDISSPILKQTFNAENLFNHSVSTYNWGTIQCFISVNGICSTLLSDLLSDSLRARYSKESVQLISAVFVYFSQSKKQANKIRTHERIIRDWSSGFKLTLTFHRTHPTQHTMTNGRLQLEDQVI